MERVRHVLVECKQECFAETNKNLRMFAAAQDLCGGYGWEFRIVTDGQMHV